MNYLINGQRIFDATKTRPVYPEDLNELQRQLIDIVGINRNINVTTSGVVQQISGTTRKWNGWFHKMEMAANTATLTNAGWEDSAAVVFWLNFPVGSVINSVSVTLSGTSGSVGGYAYLLYGEDEAEIHPAVAHPFDTSVGFVNAVTHTLDSAPLPFYITDDKAYSVLIVSASNCVADTKNNEIWSVIVNVTGVTR